MSLSFDPPEPTCYRLRVAGHLDRHWAGWFGDLALTHEADGTTSLTGFVADQAELHGLLTRVRDLGVSLVSLAMIDPVTGVAVVPAEVSRRTGS
jgi:hypothetical protein